MATKKKKRAAARKAKTSPARRTKKAAPAKRRAKKRPVARRRKSRPVRAAARKPSRPRVALRKKSAPVRKSAPVKKAAPEKKAAPGKTKRSPAVRRGRGAAGFDVETPLDPRGLGSESGGQSGDTEGLSRAELADSESVEELLEEGQAFEAGIISGVENAPDADEGEIRTREVPEDDVPQEDIDED